MYTYIHIYIYIYTNTTCWPKARRHAGGRRRGQREERLHQRRRAGSAPAKRVLSPTVPSLVLASCRMRLSCEVRKGMFPSRTRCPLS